MTLTVYSLKKQEREFVMEVENDKGERQRVEIGWEEAEWLQERLQKGLKEHLKETQVLKLGRQTRTIDIERR